MLDSGYSMLDLIRLSITSIEEQVSKIAEGFYA